MLMKYRKKRENKDYRLTHTEGSESWDHWEMRIHKRLLELVIGSAKEEGALRQVMRLPIPDTVTIELSLRTVS